MYDMVYTLSHKIKLKSMEIAFLGKKVVLLYLGFKKKNAKKGL